MEDGRSKIIIDRLIDMIENGQNVTFSSGKVAVNKEEALILIRELESIVNGELRMYRDVNDRKGRIINDAKKEAEDIIYEAEQTASRIRVTKRMSNIGTGFRADGLDEEEKMALRTAHDIYAASVIYTDEMLTEVTDVVAEAYDVISNQYGRMVTVLEEKAKLIADNKAELMAGLRELSKEERYSQIMELSQLLANELYNERHRQSEPEGYDANYDSAFGDNVAEYDDYNEYENVDYSENIGAVNSHGSIDTGSDDIEAVKSEDSVPVKQENGVADENTHMVHSVSAVEEKILEKVEKRDIDADGVELLHPVNQYENKKDPVANTLNMFKRGKRDGE